MSSNLVESLIGAVVLAVAAGFLYIAYTTTEVAGGTGYKLEARFDTIGSLGLGADVRIAGIKVGTVTDVDLDLDNVARPAGVRLTVRPDIKLPSDSTAKITSDGLLSDPYVQLQPGGMPEYMQAGDEFYDTQGPIDLFGLISKAVYSGDSGGDGDSDNDSDN